MTQPAPSTARHDRTVAPELDELEFAFYILDGGCRREFLPGSYGMSVEIDRPMPAMSRTVPVVMQPSVCTTVGSLQGNRSRPVADVGLRRQ